MVTKEQAMRAKHRATLDFVTDKGRTVTVRINGKCQTWKTRPDDFRLPVKYGLRECSNITERNASQFTFHREP